MKQLIWLIFVFVLVFGCEDAEGTATSGRVDGADSSSDTDSDTDTDTDSDTDSDSDSDVYIDPNKCGDNKKLNMIIRDFSDEHPDFNPAFNGDQGAYANVLAPTLDIDGKPVMVNPDEGYWHWEVTGVTEGGVEFNRVAVQDDGLWSKNCWGGTYEIPDDCHQNTTVFTNQDNFAEWYRDVPDVNYRFDVPLQLHETEEGSNIYYWDSFEHGELVDGKKQFFPLQDGDGFGPGPDDMNPWNKNFLFTTEIAFSFVYKKGQKFTFRGDDDLWIFVNGKLAYDLGGLHSALEGTLDFDTKANELDINPGGYYTLQIFHAERKPMESNFRIETDIDCFIPVVID